MASRDAIRAGAVARRPRERRAHLTGPKRRVTAPPVRRERIAYLDNLKVLLVAVIIAGHSIFGYAPATGIWKGSWPYQDIQEATLGGVSRVILAIPAGPAVLFAMALFFLISGLTGGPGTLDLTSAAAAPLFQNNEVFRRAPGVYVARSTGAIQQRHNVPPLDDNRLTPSSRTQGHGQPSAAAPAPIPRPVTRSDHQYAARAAQSPRGTSP